MYLCFWPLALFVEGWKAENAFDNTGRRKADDNSNYTVPKFLGNRYREGDSSTECLMSRAVKATARLTAAPSAKSIFWSRCHVVNDCPYRNRGTPGASTHPFHIR